jgi:hypothetical protein
MQRQPRERDEAYLAYIRQQRCCICGNDQGVQAAHLRMGSINDDKPSTGMAEKSSDRWAVPLCHKHHCEQHSFGDELGWWASYGIDPISLAMRYYMRKS